MKLQPILLMLHESNLTLSCLWQSFSSIGLMLPLFFNLCLCVYVCDLCTTIKNESEGDQRCDRSEHSQWVNRSGGVRAQVMIGPSKGKPLIHLLRSSFLFGRDAPITTTISCHGCQPSLPPSIINHLLRMVVTN